jgi:hypothetical protein
MSSLSSSERYMQQMEELKQKNAMFPEAQTAQTRENELKAAQAKQAIGVSKYYTGLGGQADAAAGEKTFETERDKARNNLLTPDVQQQIMAKIQGIPDLFKPKPGLAVPNAPPMNFGAKNDSNAALDMNPANVSLNQRTSGVAPTPTAISNSVESPLSQTANFPLGNPFSLPNLGSLANYLTSEKPLAKRKSLLDFSLAR